MLLGLFASLVFAAAALIRRLRGKTYIVPWRISEICFALGTASLMIVVSGGQWNMIALLAGILMIGCGICQALACWIRKIRHKPAKSAGIKAAVLSGMGFCAAVAAVSGSLSTALNLFAAVFFLAALIMLFVNAVRAVLRKKTRLLWLWVPACLLMGMLLVTAADYSWERRLAERTASGEIHEEPIQISYDFEVADGDAPIEVVTSKTLDLRDGQSIYVYDEQDLHLALKQDFATARQCIEAIHANDKIEAGFKTFFIDFVERIGENYPNLNLAILYQNLGTLDVQELNSTDYLWESLSATSLGCYNKRKNTIFIPEGTEYIEGEFGFQVLLHEFCHAARLAEYKNGNSKYSFNFYEDSDNVLLAEAMNSVFSCSLLDYYEWNIAYQVPSNYLRIMLECMDNYSLEDYIKHRDTYFLRKLDEFTGKTNYAQAIWKLIALQRSDWEQEKMDIPPEEYYPIYDFLCGMYYDKYISKDMTDAQKKAVADELVRKAFYDAPENYKIAPDYFYAYLGL